MDFKHIQRIKFRLVNFLLLPVKEDVINTLKLVFRHVGHRSAKGHIVRGKGFPRCDVHPLDIAELTTTYIADDVPVTKSKIVQILICPIRRVEKFKNFVTLNIDGLNKDQLVVRPLSSIGMGRSVFRKVYNSAVADLTK